MRSVLQLPELAFVRVLTAGGPYAAGDVLSVAFLSPFVGRLAAHGPAPDAAALGDYAFPLVPDSVSAVVVRSTGAYRAGDELTLSFVDPAVARIHPNRPQSARSTDTEPQSPKTSRAVNAVSDADAASAGATHEALAAHVLSLADESIHALPTVLPNDPLAAGAGGRCDAAETYGAQRNDSKRRGDDALTSRKAHDATPLDVRREDTTVGNAMPGNAMPGDISTDGMNNGRAKHGDAVIPSVKTSDVASFDVKPDNVDIHPWQRRAAAALEPLEVNDVKPIDVASDDIDIGGAQQGDAAAIAAVEAKDVKTIDFAPGDIKFGAKRGDRSALDGTLEALELYGAGPDGGRSSSATNDIVRRSHAASNETQLRDAGLRDLSLDRVAAQSLVDGAPVGNRSTREDARAIGARTGVRVRLEWSPDRVRRFVRVIDKLFTVDRLGWYRHALAMRLLVPDSIATGDQLTDVEAMRHLHALRAAAVETLGRPLLAAFMPNFSVTQEWLDGLDSPSAARALAGLREAIVPHVDDTLLPGADELDRTWTVGTIHAQDLQAPPSSVEALLPVLIASFSPNRDLSEHLAGYRRALSDIFGQTANCADAVRLNVMAQPNHSLDDRLWRLVGVVGDTFGTPAGT